MNIRNIRRQGNNRCPRPRWAWVIDRNYLWYDSVLVCIELDNLVSSANPARVKKGSSSHLEVNADPSVNASIKTLPSIRSELWVFEVSIYDEVSALTVLGQANVADCDSMHIGNSSTAELKHIIPWLGVNLGSRWLHI